jgi:hypothetical protein
MLFDKVGRGIPKPLPLHLYVEPSQWVDTAHYFGVTLHTQLTWLTHIYNVRRKAADSECRDLSYTEVVSPSAMEFCCTSR